MGVSMDKFIAQNFKVKKAKDTFNGRYDVYKTAAKRYFVYDHRSSSTKLAGDMDFEQNFFQLAFTYIKDKIPTLIDFMVGFEVVDKNEDGTQSLGLFMFDIRGRKFYVPVMYSNGELKGADLLYDKSADRFIPNKDNWVDYVLSQSPAETGFSATDNEEDLDFAEPDVKDLFDGDPYKSSNATPSVGMTGLNGLVSEGDEVKVEEDESEDDDGPSDYAQALAVDDEDRATEAYTADESKDASAFSTMSDLGQAPGWGSLLDFFRNEDGSFANKFAQALAREPELHKAAHTFYGDDLYSALEDATFVSDTDLPKVAAEEPKVKIISSPMDPGVREILNEEEIQSLVEDGIAFVDRRDEEEKSVPYQVISELAVSSPTEPGMYEVLLRGGGFKEVMIFSDILGHKNYFLNPYDGDQTNTYGGGDFHVETEVDRTRSCLLVDDSVAYTSDPYNVLVKVNNPANRSFKDYVLGLPSVSELAVSRQPASGAADRNVNKYVIVDCNTYSVTPPLFIEDKVTTDGVDNMNVYAGDSLIKNVVVSDSHKGVKYMQGTIFAGPDCKIIKLNQPKYGEGKMVLGTHFDLDKVLKREFEEVKVSCVGKDEYHVFGGDVTEPFCMHNKALTTLVTKLGLDASEARSLIKEAKAHGVKKQLYKLAAPGDMRYPSVPDPSTFTTDSTLGVMEQSPGAELVPAMESGSGDPQRDAIEASITGMNQSSGPAMTPESVQEILQAAQTGEREVFDTATISNLLDANEIDALLTRFTKDLNIALDRLGRLAFLMMMHRSKFLDRFGSDDIIDMEDSLNNTFKGLGELVLKLKEREITSDAGFAVETDLSEVS